MNIPKSDHTPVKRTSDAPAHRRTASNTDALKAANVQLLRDDIAKRRTVFRGMPDVVSINHTDICNLSCIMCPRSITKGSQTLSVDLLNHLASELFPTARKLVLTAAAGEPLATLRRELFEQARRHSVKVDLITNGTLLTPEVYLEIHDSLDHINISIDSFDPLTYASIRGKPLIKTVADNLKEIATIRAKVDDDVLMSLSAVVMTSNIDTLSSFLHVAAGLNIEGVIFQKLQHSVKESFHLDPERALGTTVLQDYLNQWETEARSLSMNLSLSEFGRTPVISRPIRSKVNSIFSTPTSCWSLAQNFQVSFNGEVYPCCVSTDHYLGNALYEDPAEIWNGLPMQKLRARHFALQRTMFCSGCLHASHLPTMPRDLQGRVEKVRLRVRDRGTTRRTRPGTPPIYRPKFPEHEVVPARFREPPASAAKVAYCPRLELADRTGSGDLLYCSSSSVDRAEGGDFSRSKHIADLSEIATGCFSALRSINDDRFLFSFEGSGSLWEWTRGEVKAILKLSDRRSFVRQNGIALDPHGNVWVGEYGVYPGARCANLYLINTRGEPRLVSRFPGRHIHVVTAISTGEVLVTTGDLAGEQKLYLVNAFKPALLLDAWSGFTAALQQGTSIWLGSDLAEGNFLARLSVTQRSHPTVFPLPLTLDMPVKALRETSNGGILALLSHDADALASHVSKTTSGALLGSWDNGASWLTIHRFHRDDSDLPEDMVQLPLSAEQFITCVSGDLTMERRSRLITLDAEGALE